MSALDRRSCLVKHRSFVGCSPALTVCGRRRRGSQGRRLRHKSRGAGQLQRKDLGPWTVQDGPRERQGPRAVQEGPRTRLIGDGRRLDVTADEVTVESVAVAAGQAADVTDELVGDAVAAHVDRMQDVVVEHNAAVPAERCQLQVGRR